MRERPLDEDRSFDLGLASDFEDDCGWRKVDVGIGRSLGSHPGIKSIWPSSTFLHLVELRCSIAKSGIRPPPSQK